MTWKYKHEMQVHTIILEAGLEAAACSWKLLMLCRFCHSFLSFIKVSIAVCGPKGSVDLSQLYIHLSIIGM